MALGSTVGAQDAAAATPSTVRTATLTPASTATAAPRPTAWRSDAFPAPTAVHTPRAPRSAYKCILI
ncbi:hypothetical protein ABZX40_09815 [Streptomyces sp. NPDC004610]|uniref:hypothetical protein n=1 Tax=unclassified Streptomyces TaxID=2593676 RepID=UPI0033B3BE93